MNKLFALTLMTSFCAAVALYAGAASAREEPLRFIHALQRSGYGDMAVEYLDLLAKRPDLPPEIRDVWDLEMSKSLKAAAADAFDAREYQRLIGRVAQAPGEVPQGEARTARPRPTPWPSGATSC